MNSLNPPVKAAHTPAHPPEFRPGPLRPRLAAFLAALRSETRVVVEAIDYEFWDGVDATVAVRGTSGSMGLVDAVRRIQEAAGKCTSVLLRPLPSWAPVCDMRAFPGWALFDLRIYSHGPASPDAMTLPERVTAALTGPRHDVGEERAATGWTVSQRPKPLANATMIGDLAPLLRAMTSDHVVPVHREENPYPMHLIAVVAVWGLEGLREFVDASWSLGDRLHASKSGGGARTYVLCGSEQYAKYGLEEESDWLLVELLLRGQGTAILDPITKEAVALGVRTFQRHIPGSASATSRVPSLLRRLLQ
jgi:hypothetical protein